MASLTPKLAQIIVNKMMDVIPYNVNIMNSEGIIIGSGDNTRIGKVHEGAVNAIYSKKLVAIYEDRGHVKRGVNMPIYFKDEIMGVIGISGNPHIVNNFAAIVTVTAELLINQEYLFTKKRTKEQLKDQFLYQWAFSDEQYKDDFIKRAESLEIDLTLERRAVAINFIKSGSKDSLKINLSKLRSYITNNEYIIRLNDETVILLLMEDEYITNYRIKNFQKTISHKVAIGVGNKNNIISKSVHEAIRCIDIIKGFNKHIPINDFYIVTYKQIASIDALYKISCKESYRNLILKLYDEGKNSELIKTLLCFIKHSGEMSIIADELHIHRNSLNYRLEKIKEITGKDPKNFLDLLHLFTAMVVYVLE